MRANNCHPPSGTQWAPQETIHLQGQDCDGNLIDFAGKPTQLINTVPAPGSVQTVRFCTDIPTVAPVVLILIPRSIRITGGASGVVTGLVPVFSVTIIATGPGVEYSTDGGVTWVALPLGARTWGNSPNALMATASLVARGNLAESVFEIIWEAY